MGMLANRYEVLETLGVGGMGTVHKGYDTETQAYVAIKALKPHPDLEYQDALQHFLQEGELLRQLNHPNIVQLLDTFADENTQYIVMEYVGGGDLERWLQSYKRLPVSDVLHIGVELADALHSAHRLNIIHRDLKPANVLIDQDQTL